MPRLLIVLLLIVLAPCPVLAQSPTDEDSSRPDEPSDRAAPSGSSPRSIWAPSFSAKAVAPHAAGKLLVLGAGKGESLAQAQAAAKLLREALGKQEGVELVMDASALGQVQDLDDDTILTKTVKLPVQRVVILRAFALGEDGRYSLVLSWYDNKSKKLNYAQSINPGDILPVPPGEASQGVSERTQETVFEKSQPPEEKEESKLLYPPSLRARQAYEAGLIFWAVTENPITDKQEHDYTKAYRGLRRKEVLEGEELFMALDAPELLNNYRRNRRRLRLTAGTGVFVVLAGGALAGYAAYIHYGPCADLQFGCEEDAYVPALSITGGVLSVVGLALMAYGLTASALPGVSPSVLEALPKRHNRELRRKLGFTDEPQPRKKPAKKMRLNLSIFGAPQQGGGLSLHGTF